MDVHTILEHITVGKGNVVGACSSHGLNGFLIGEVIYVIIAALAFAHLVLFDMKKENKHIAACFFALDIIAAVVDFGLEVCSFTYALSAPLGRKIAWVVVWSIYKIVYTAYTIRQYVKARREATTSSRSSMELGEGGAERLDVNTTTTTTTNTDDSAVRMADYSIRESTVDIRITAAPTQPRKWKDNVACV